MKMPAGERATSWRAPGAIIAHSTPVELLLERLNNVQPSGSGRWTATCPAHGSGTNRALSIAVRGSKTLIHCFAGCAADAVLSAVGLDWRDLRAGTARPWRPSLPPALRLPPSRRTPDPVDDRHQRWLERVWSGARPVQSNDAVSRYLRQRGLALDTYPVTLRYHPTLDYYDLDAKTGKLVSRGKYPTMLALVEHPQRGSVALHRTHITEDGHKAAVLCPKKLLGSGVAGAAIRLYPATERLAVAEGVETALAVHQMTAWPVWATISAGGMRALELPDSVREVLICADNDHSGVGQDAARALARRLVAESWRVRLAIPPEPGSDWLDVLTGAAS